MSGRKCYEYPYRVARSVRLSIGRWSLLLVRWFGCSCVSFVRSRGRPLQWAIQNKHVECVKALLELYPESSQMNVLDKNGFGKSALTDVSERLRFVRRTVDWLALGL